MMILIAIVAWVGGFSCGCIHMRTQDLKNDIKRRGRK